MAIYHLSLKEMRRSQGRSSVAAAAYRLGEKMKDERIGKTFNYSKKSGILDKFFILPNGAKNFQNTSHFWNEAERSENRKNSVVAREIIINLPYEISDQQRSELVKKFCNEIVANHSVGITAAIHEPCKDGDDRNFHAHILFTTRQITAEGFGKKTREFDDKKQGVEVLKNIRKRYEILQNEALKNAGFNDIKVDCRSFKEQGIFDKQPSKHLGVEVVNLERRKNKNKLPDEPEFKSEKRKRIEAKQATAEFYQQAQVIKAVNVELNNTKNNLEIVENEIKILEIEKENLLKKYAEEQEKLELKKLVEIERQRQQILLAEIKDLENKIFYLEKDTSKKKHRQRTAKNLQHLEKISASDLAKFVKEHSSKIEPEYNIYKKYISNIFSKIFTKILNIGTAIVSSIDNFSDNIEARQRWLELQHQRLDKLEQLEKIKNTTFDPFKPSLKDMAKILNSSIKPQQNINSNSNKNITVNVAVNKPATNDNLQQNKLVNNSLKPTQNVNIPDAKLQQQLEKEKQLQLEQKAKEQQLKSKLLLIENVARSFKNLFAIAKNINNSIIVAERQQKLELELEQRKNQTLLSENEQLENKLELLKTQIKTIKSELAVNKNLKNYTIKFNNNKSIAVKIKKEFLPLIDSVFQNVIVMFAGNYKLKALRNKLDEEVKKEKIEQQEIIEYKKYFKQFSKPKEYREFYENLHLFFKLIHNKCSSKQLLDDKFCELKNTIEDFTKYGLNKASLDFLLEATFQLNIAYPDGKGIFRLLERPTEECYKKSIYSQDITRYFRRSANKYLYDIGYNFADDPEKVYNRKANLEAKRLKRLAAKNKQNYDNDDDENDGGNDGFGIK